MSRRQQAAARQRIRELERRLASAETVIQATTLTTWSGIGQRMRDQINTSRTLGYAVEVRTSGDDSITLTAVKREAVQ